jgi:hypothetical protein
MILEYEREGKSLQEIGIDKSSTLLVESLYILGKLWLFLLRALHITKEILIQIVKCTASCLINIKNIV